MTVADLDDDAVYLPIPPDKLQLQADTLNVIEGRISLASFPPEYQKKITDYYRFSADLQNRRSPQKPARRIRETMDLI